MERRMTQFVGPWVLIIWFTGNHGVALVAHEFLSKPACDNAGKVLAMKGGFQYEIDFACVPKDLRNAIR
jgi:hypothetical protein